jgi:hypothetical protein
MKHGGGLFMNKKILILGVMMIMCLWNLTGCADYRYEYHFSVIGDGGVIDTDPRQTDVYGVEINCTSPIILRGNKNGGHQLKFVAIPNTGYQVKEWAFNDEIVANNKTNTFTAVISKRQYICYVTVEFEPSKTINQNEEN